MRELIYDEKGQIVRQKTERRDGRADRRRVSAGAASRARPARREGVFVVRDRQVEFMPVKTGIAGDKYFEVLSGLKDGDQVVTGPVQLRPRLWRTATPSRSTAPTRQTQA